MYNKENKENNIHQDFLIEEHINNSLELNNFNKEEFKEQIEENIKIKRKNNIINCLKFLTYKIPNIIHYTFKNYNIPQSIKNIVEHNKKVCKDCNFIFYNDENIDNFIRLNFNNYILIIIHEIL
jgi:mannosyltransferase OCH1-like enzyme